MHQVWHTLIAALPLLLAQSPAHAYCIIDCHPTQADARSVFQNLLRDEAAFDPYVLLAFREEANSQIRIPGRMFHLIHYLARVSFPQGVHARCLTANYDPNLLSKPCEWRHFKATHGAPPNYLDATVHFDGWVVFEQTAQGWRAIDNNFYARPLCISLSPGHVAERLIRHHDRHTNNDLQPINTAMLRLCRELHHASPLFPAAVPITTLQARRDGSFRMILDQPTHSRYKPQATPS
jgi:hypothetical protein